MLDYFLCVESDTVSLRRPLALLRASTFLPFLDAILDLNPCLLALFLLDGWYVRFIMKENYIVFNRFFSKARQRYGPYAINTTDWSIIISLIVCGMQIDHILRKRHMYRYLVYKQQACSIVSFHRCP